MTVAPFNSRLLRFGDLGAFFNGFGCFWLFFLGNGVEDSVGFVCVSLFLLIVEFVDNSVVEDEIEVELVNVADEVEDEDEVEVELVLSDDVVFVDVFDETDTSFSGTSAEIGSLFMLAISAPFTMRRFFLRFIVLSVFITFGGIGSFTYNVTFFCRCKDITI